MHMHVSLFFDALADYLSAHLEDAIGLYGSFEDAVWDAVRTGRMASTVHGYVGDLRTGKDSRGRVPYGGALEIELFVRVWPALKVRVWATPGDVLARGTVRATLPAEAWKPRILPCFAASFRFLAGI